MKTPSHLKSTITLAVRGSIRCPPLRRVFLFVPLLLACFALSPRAQAVVPAPDGGYANGNTAEGTNALFSLTSGVWNTAVGAQALNHDTTGGANTATGLQALFNNTIGNRNTAYGSRSLYRNFTGEENTATGVQALMNNAVDQNTADGFQALMNNSSGYLNVATGWRALFRNDVGVENTATGAQSLFHNTTGSFNTATGARALLSNTEGHENTATGYQALGSNTIGFLNTAHGEGALSSVTTGGGNIGLGAHAGDHVTRGSFNIDIGNEGLTNDAGTIRLGTQGYQERTFVAGISGVAVAGDPVVVSFIGQLGVASCSARFKDEIKPMGKASEAILALKPVTFHYKKDIDPRARPQFGLIAEEVAKVNPDLVSHDEKGELYTVRYEAVNAMLLNEFLKEHRKNEEQEATIAELKKAIARLAARDEEQAAQIQKVSAQLEASKPAPQVVNNP
jgi:trimeric autotransporter adhesin